MKYVIELTSSQRQALADLILAYLLAEKITVQNFVDRTQLPPVETEPGKLLGVVLSAKEVPE